MLLHDHVYTVRILYPCHAQSGSASFAVLPATPPLSLSHSPDPADPEASKSRRLTSFNASTGPRPKSTMRCRTTLARPVNVQEHTHTPSEFVAMYLGAQKRGCEARHLEASPEACQTDSRHVYCLCYKDTASKTGSTAGNNRHVCCLCPPVYTLGCFSDTHRARCPPAAAAVAALAHRRMNSLVCF